MKFLQSLSLCCTSLFVLSACSSSDDGTAESTTRTATKRLASLTFTASDGVVKLTTLQYLDNGYLAGVVDTLNGEESFSVAYEHDSTGRLTRGSVDLDQDGVENRYVTYVYDDILGLIRINRHVEDNSIGSVVVYGFDNGLAVSRETLDIDNAATSGLVDETTGVLQAQQTIEYENGRLSANTFDYDADGVIDARQDFSYNLDGTMSTSTTTSISDGTTGVTTYDYEDGLCHENHTNSRAAWVCVVIN